MVQFEIKEGLIGRKFDTALLKRAQELTHVIYNPCGPRNQFDLEAKSLGPFQCPQVASQDNLEVATGVPERAAEKLLVFALQMV